MRSFSFKLHQLAKTLKPQVKWTLIISYNAMFWWETLYPGIHVVTYIISDKAKPNPKNLTSENCHLTWLFFLVAYVIDKIVNWNAALDICNMHRAEPFYFSSFSVEAEQKPFFTDFEPIQNGWSQLKFLVWCVYARIKNLTCHSHFNFIRHTRSTRSLIFLPNTVSKTTNQDPKSGTTTMSYWWGRILCGQ